MLFVAAVDVQGCVADWVREYAYTLINAAPGDRPASLTIGVFDKSLRPCPLFFAPSTPFDEAAATVRATVATSVRASVLPQRPLDGIVVELTVVAIRPDDLVPDDPTTGLNQPLLLQFADFKSLTRAASKFLGKHDSLGGKVSCLIPFWDDVPAMWPRNPLSMSDATPINTVWFGVSAGASVECVQILRDRAISQPSPDFNQLRPASAFIATISFSALDGIVFSPSANVSSEYYAQRGFGASTNKLGALESSLLSSTRPAWAKRTEAIIHGGSTLSLLIHGSSVESSVAAAMRNHLPLGSWFYDTYQSGADREEARLSILAGLRLRQGSSALQIVADMSGISDLSTISAFVDDIVRLGVDGRQCVDVTLLIPHLAVAWNVVSAALSAWCSRRRAGPTPMVEFRVHHCTIVREMLISRSQFVANASPTSLTPDLRQCAKVFLDGNTSAFISSELVYLPASDRVDFPRDNEAVLVDAIAHAISSARPQHPRIVLVGKRWFGSGATTAAWRCAHNARAKSLVPRVQVGMAELVADVPGAIAAVAASAASGDPDPSTLAVVVVLRSSQRLKVDDIRRHLATCPARIVVVNVVDHCVTPITHNFGALLSDGEMLRGISTYERVFSESELVWLSDLRALLESRRDGSSSAGAPHVGVDRFEPVNKLTGCNLLTLGLAARFHAFSPIIDALFSPSDDPLSAAVARLVLTVATLELFTSRPVFEHGGTNPVALAHADLFSKRVDVQVLLQQQPRRAYPVTLHPGFAPLLLQYSVNHVSAARVTRYSVGGAAYDRLLTVLGDTVAHLFSLRAFDAVDDLVIDPLSSSSSKSPLIRGLLDLNVNLNKPGYAATPSYAAMPGYAAVDFLSLLLQPGSVLAPNPLLDRPNIRQYYVLLSKLARTASIDAAQLAASEKKRTAPAADASAKALQLAVLGVAAAERAWNCVRPADWPLHPDESITSIFDLSAFRGGGIAVADDSAATAEAKAFIKKQGEVLGSLERVVNGKSAQPGYFAGMAGLLHQVVTIRELAARQAYEYSRLRATPPYTLAAGALFDVQISSLVLLQHLLALSDNLPSKRVDLRSALHIFQRLTAPDERRWTAIHSLYAFFAGAAPSVGFPSWPAFESYIRKAEAIPDGFAGCVDPRMVSAPDSHLPPLAGVGPAVAANALAPPAMNGKSYAVVAAAAAVLPSADGSRSMSDAASVDEGDVPRISLLLRQIASSEMPLSVDVVSRLNAHTVESVGGGGDSRSA